MCWLTPTPAPADIVSRLSTATVQEGTPLSAIVNACTISEATSERGFRRLGEALAKGIAVEDPRADERHPSGQMPTVNTAPKQRQVGRERNL